MLNFISRDSKEFHLWSVVCLKLAALVVIKRLGPERGWKYLDVFATPLEAKV
jgi:hypothetical protein